MDSRKSACGTRTLLIIVLVQVVLWLPPIVRAAPTVASVAMAAAIESGTFDQLKQEMMMDAHAQQKFEFDEAGMEDLGRQQLATGNTSLAVEILQLNQVIHHTSPRAANALGDAYRDAGEEIQARIYYNTALRLDPDNEHASQAIDELGGAEELAAEAMGEMEFDPAAMQEAMAQWGAEMTPEQQQQMQEAMAQLQQYQADPSSYQAPAEQRNERSSPQSSSSAQPAYESEFCEVLHRFNAEKKIPDSSLRSRFEGEYGQPDDPLRTWNVESACGEFLIAVPLWADVSPPVMHHRGGGQFEDSMGGAWSFALGAGNKAIAVTFTGVDGTVSEMTRLGDPRSLD